MSGDIVLVDFPFFHGVGTKVRPALVVQDDRVPSANTIIAQITSNLSRTGRTRVLVDPTKEAATGLLVPSMIVGESLYTIHQSRVIKTIGSLSSPLMHQVDQCLKAALGLP
jgi:mRNA interferase MazF